MKPLITWTRTWDEESERSRLGPGNFMCPLKFTRVDGEHVNTVIVVAVGDGVYLRNW